MRHAAALGFALLLATQASAMGKFPPSPDPDPGPPAAPEPAAIAVFAVGGAVIGWSLYRRRK